MGMPEVTASLRSRISAVSGIARSALLTADVAAAPAARPPELARAAAEPGPPPLIGRCDGAYVLLVPTEPDPRDTLRRVLANAGQAALTAGTPARRESHDHRRSP